MLHGYNLASVPAKPYCRAEISAGRNDDRVRGNAGDCSCDRPGVQDDLSSPPKVKCFSRKSSEAVITQKWLWIADYN